MIMALSTLLSVLPGFQRFDEPTPEDFQIISNTVTDGVRTIVAVPSPMVCSKQITITIDAKTDVIQSAVFRGGCPGNLKAINKLLNGVTVQDAINKLDGIPCGNRPTSCTDQLARVLKACYKIN